MVALAETSPAVLDLRQASKWCRQWCEASAPARRPGTVATQSWTSALSRHLDRRVIDGAVESRLARIAQVSPVVATGELHFLGFSTPVAAVAAELACSGEGVSVLARAPWLVQAACIDAARAAWQAAGITVRVASPSELSDRRWRALTSLQAFRPSDRGAAGSDPHGYMHLGAARPGRRVLVVDAADHLSPPALARLIDQASSSRTKLVLVLGGTVGGRQASLASSLDELAGPAQILSTGTVAGPDQVLSVAGPAQVLSAAGLAPAAGSYAATSYRPAVSVRGIVVQGSFTGADAMAHLLAAWGGAAHEGPTPPLMIAFGPPEAEALNVAARQDPRYGPKTGAPEVLFGERLYAVGDQVLALRRMGKVHAGARGRVTDFDRGALVVDWRGRSGPRTSAVDLAEARSVAYGYATTLPYLRGVEGSGSGAPVALLVLGDPRQLGSRASEVRGAWTAVAGPGLPSPGMDGYQARTRAALAELATGWPDAEMLERAGPRPLSPLLLRRWCDIVTGCAAERSLCLDARLALPTDVRPRNIGPEPSRGPRGPSLTLGL
jgi:hypothetical protein